MLFDMAAGRRRGQTCVLITLATFVFVNVELKKIRPIEVVSLLVCIRNDGILLLG